MNMVPNGRMPAQRQQQQQAFTASAQGYNKQQYDTMDVGAVRHKSMVTNGRMPAQRQQQAFMASAQE
jgi:hypothetical protein